MASEYGDSAVMDPQPFRVDRSELFKEALLSPGSGWPLWTVVAVGIVLVLAGAMSDVRVLAVGLMVCVAVAPGLGAIICLSHSLAPDRVANVIPHTLERTPDGYLLRIWRKEEEAEEGADPGCRWVENGEVTLRDENIVERKTTFRYDVFYFKDSRLKILYVPRF